MFVFSLELKNYFFHLIVHKFL